MKKTVLVLMLGALLIAGNLYAAGDLIVEGKVGIGTNNPLQSLHVKEGIVRVDRTGAPSTVIVNRTDRKAVSIAAGWDAGTFRFDDTGAFRIQAQRRADLIAGNGLNIVHLVNVDANGNVGIGTTNPTAKLDVNGSINYDDQKVCYAIEDGISLSNDVPSSWTLKDCARVTYDFCGNKNSPSCRFYLACVGENGKHSWSYDYQASIYVNSSANGNNLTWMSGGYFSAANFCGW